MGTVPRQPGFLYRLCYALWADNVNDVHSAADWTQLGADYEVVIGHHQQYGGNASAKSTAVVNLHAGAAAAGREAKGLVYVNGTFGEAADFPTGGHHRKDAFLYSGDPALPYCWDSFRTYLMDPRSRGWYEVCQSTQPVGTRSVSVPEQHTERAITVFGSTPADGSMPDSLGWGIVTSGYSVKSSGDGNPPTTPTSFGAGTNITPTNDQTGNQWISATDKSLWVDATVRVLLGCTAQRVGGEQMSVYCNGVSQGARWFDADGPTWRLARFTNGPVMAENWIRSATSPVATFPSSAADLDDWKAHVNYVMDAQNLGKGAMLWTKVWGNHGHTDDVLWDPPIATTTSLPLPVGHGFSNGDKVVVAGSGTLPSGLSDSNMYYVVNRTTTSIDFANSSGGGAINISGGSPQNVRVRKVISQNNTDDNNDPDVVRWHRLWLGSIMLATDGRSFGHFVHDWPNGNQRIQKDRWFDKVNAMGWYTESWNTGIGVWATVSGDTFTATAHGFANSQQVIVDCDKMPGGISARTTMFVRQKATDTFKLATTNSDGTIVTTSSAGSNIRVRSADGANGNSCGIMNGRDPTSTNIFVRRFEHGITIVNPLGSATLNTFTLPGGTWYDVDDTPLSGTITVDNTKYAVLLRDAL